MVAQANAGKNVGQQFRSNETHKYCWQKTTLTHALDSDEESRRIHAWYTASSKII